MSALRCVCVLLLLAVSCWAEDEQELSVSELLWKANKDVVRTASEPLVIDDIAFDPDSERNADACTSRGCMWPKSADRRVYVAYTIAGHYTSRERSLIERGLSSFSDSTCVRFIPRSSQPDYISIQSDSGCYSYVGRRGNGQTVSLDKQGCLYHSTVQHELLHALGFNHEQCRSDRDQYIKVLWHNIQSGKNHTRSGKKHINHTQSGKKHTQSGQNHTRSCQNHTRSGQNHTQSGQNHTRSGQNHTQSGQNHTQSGQNHTRSGQNHTQSGQNHTQSGQNHTQSGQNHTQSGQNHTLPGKNHINHTQSGKNHTHQVKNT
ncbi:low choriolytic enzyme-like isoform X1 [Eucyclogobius newberryi]|uniref:low choriolytic enzyme-like isoform X1 n=1 Tax=Eucyclogobius newberryi TaxID=166745 RepID=UPI003B5ACEC9